MNGQVFLSSTTAWWILGAFSILWLILGFYWNRRSKNTTNDYIFAGRSVGLALSTATLLAAWVTGNTVLSAPEMSYTIGVWGFLGYCMAGLSLVFFAPIAVRIKKLIPDGYTSGDFIRLRYGKKAWGIFLVISICYLLGFLITQGMGAGILIQALTGMDYHVGLVAIVAVVTIYTLLGGMKAVLGTDFVQSILITLCLFIVAIFAFKNIGVGHIYHVVMTEKPSRMNLLLPAGLFFAWNTGVFAMGEIFHGNTWWQRVFSMKTESTYKSFVLSGVTWIFVPVVTGLIAFVAISEHYNVPQVNMVFPIVAAKLLGSGGAVLVFIIIYNSLASTVSALLSSSSAFLVDNIYRQLINPNVSDAKMNVISKFLIVFLGVLTIVLAWGQFSSIFSFFLLMGPLVASTVWPIAMGVFWKESNRTGAFWAMLLGSVLGLVSYFELATYSSALISALVSAIVMLVFTKLRPEKFEWKTLSSHNEKPEEARGDYRGTHIHNI